MRSDDIRALHEQRANIHHQMVEMSADAEKESRDFTAEEKDKFDKLASEFEEVRNRADRAEELYKQEREVNKIIHTPIETRIGSDDDVPMSFSEYRKKTSGERIWNSPEYRAAYWKYMTVKSLSELEVEEQRVLSKASAGAGANLVPTDFYNQIVNVIRFMGPINELATTITTDSGETLQIPSVTSHGVATWTAENAAYTASDEVFGQTPINAFKAGRQVIVSEELLQDSAFELDSYLAQELGESIGVLEETAYTVGDGSAKPLGIAHASSGVSIVQAGAGAGNVTAFTYSALIGFMFALPYQYRRNAVWIFSDSGVRNFYTMADTANRPLWAVNTAVGQADTFMGFPIYTSPDLAVVAASAKSGIFGDIRRGYMIRRVNGFSLQRQNELYSANGQVGFRGFERVDGRVVLADAMRVLQNAAT